MTSTPVVMSIASHDPSGGGSLSADIETLASLGCHCTSIITQLCARDTSSIKDNHIIDAGFLIEQTRVVLEDIKVNVFNIGDLASIANAEAIHTILSEYQHIPVVFHPQLQPHTDIAFNNALCSLLIPQATIVILNKDDALDLTPGADTLVASARELLEYGCENLLITGDYAGNSHNHQPQSSLTHSHQTHNHWFSQRASSQLYSWDRLPYDYHGAGAILAAATSAYLAHGLSMTESLQQAQRFTWQALQQGRRIGMGQLLPNRMHWCKK